MTSARFAALLCVQLVSAMAWAQTVSFDLPTTEVVNRSNVAFLAFGGSCSNEGEQVTVSGPSAFSATAQCRDSGRWDIANVSLTHLADGSLSFTARHASTAQASRTLRKDTVAPSLALQQPTNGSSIDDVNQGALLVRGTCGDLNQPVTVRARPATANAPMVERQLTCPASRSFSTTLDVSGLPDGDTQIFVQHRDAAGNTAQQDIILYKDAVPLQVTFTPVGTHISAQQSASLLLGGTCNKPGNALYLDVTGPSGYLVSLLTYCGADETWGFANVSVTDAPDEELTFTATLTHALTGGFVSVQVSALKDTMPPVVMVFTPAHGDRVTSATGTALHVSGTCSDATPVSVAVANQAAVETSCHAGAFSLQYDVASLPDGDLVLRVLQTDEAGNVGRQDLSLQKDVQPAAVSVVQPVSGAFINTANAASFRFTGACSEHGSFAEPVRLTGAVSATALCVAGSWSVSLNLTELPEGPVSVRVTHGDTAGNPPAEVLLSLTKDVVPPLLQITSPDANLGEKGIVNAGNVDTLEILGSCSEDGRSLQVSGALTGAATCLGGAFEFRPDLHAAPDGDLLLHFTLTDAAGNSATQTLGLFKDVQPPAITLANAGDPLVLNAQPAVELLLSGECTEHGSFATPVALTAPTGALAVCVAGQWSLAVSLSGVPEGMGVLRLEHRDAAGNLAVLERAYVKDTVPPLLSVTHPAAGFLVNAGNQHAVPVAGACEDSGGLVTLLTAAGQSTVGCAGGTYSTTLDVTGAVDGDVLIRARQEDAMGNATVQDVLVFKDVAPPSLTLANAGDPLGLNAATAPDTVLTGTCSEHGSFAAPVLLVAPVAATAACVDGTWALHVSLSELPDGGGTLELEHTDRAGNRVRLARAYVKDTVAPALTLTQPGPGFLVNAANASAVRVAGTCNEEGRAVELSGPVSASTLCTAGRYQVDVSLSGAPDGDVILRARLADTAGNATVQDVIVHKDTVAPTLTLTSVADPVVVNAGSSSGLWLSGDCSEHSAPVELLSPVTASAACNGVTWSLMVSLTELPDGSGTLELKHQDVAGNAARLSRAYRKDTVAPLLALTRPVANEVINASRKNAVQVSGTCNEEGQRVEVTAPVAASAPCTGGQFSLALDLGGVPDGDVAIRTRLRDAAGNETRQDVLVQKDTVVPTLSLTSGGTPFQIPVTPGASVTLSGRCSEHTGAPQLVRLVSPVQASAACNAGTWSLQLNADVFPAGWGTLGLTHSDTAGNVARVERQTFKQPRVPLLTVTSPAAGAPTAFFARIEGTCSEDGRIVELLAPVTASASCGSGKFSVYAQLYSFPDGLVTLRLRHTNAQGGEVLVDHPVVLDKVPPTLTWTEPARWDLGSRDTLTLGGTCSEPGRPVFIRGAFTAQVPCSDTGTFTMSFALTTWGSIPVELQHQDAVGLSTSVKRQFERCPSYATMVPNPQVGGSGPMVHADINADGTLDVVMVSAVEGSRGVKLQLGRPGGGGFEAPTLITTPYLAKVTVADFNADGALDLAFPNRDYFANGVDLMTGRWLNGRPSGTFNPPFFYPLPSTSQVIAAHVNDDDILDLVTVSAATPNAHRSHQVRVSYGRQACGPGVDFDPSVVAYQSPDSRELAALTAADVDKDGRDDLFIGGDWGPLTLVSSLPAGGPVGFAAPVTFPTELTSFDSYSRIIAEDLDGDGHLDVAGLDSWHRNVVFLRSSGPGTFHAPRILGVPYNATELVAADMNADGRKDLVVGGARVVTVYPTQPQPVSGADGFATAVGYPLDAASNGLLVTDLNADFVPDFLLREENGTRLVLQHRTEAALPPDPFQRVVKELPPDSYVGHFVTADFNADGLLDVVFRSGTSVSMMRGRGSGGVGDGTFDPPYRISDSLYSANRMVAADFNKDGALDLAAVSYNGDTFFSVVFGNRPGGVPDGTFSSPVHYPTGIPRHSFNSTSRLFVGDFNGDGVLDLLSAYRNMSGTETLVLLPGQGTDGVGDGTFAPATLIPLQVPAQDMLAADLNRDGVPEVVLSVSFRDSSRSREEVHVLFRDASGGAFFLPPVIYPASGSLYALLLGDFNMDGALDIHPLGEGTRQTLFGDLVNGVPTGGGTRSNTTTFEGAYVSAKSVVDYSGDGVPDIVGGSPRGLNLLHRRMDSPGYHYFPRFTYSLPDIHTSHVAAADFNGDGRPDIAYGGTRHFTILMSRAPPAP